MNKVLIKKLAPSFLLDSYYFLLPLIGAFFYGFPSRKLIVIGVTGTNGKSTVVEMCHKILEEAGHKTASLSSIRFRIGEKEQKNSLKMTMPGRFKMQKFLKQAVDAGCQYAILEVTSEGIKQYRHKFIYFDVAVITNLTPEHIERHGSFEKYREAKAKLFQSLANPKSFTRLNFVSQNFSGQVLNSKLQISKTAIVNLDDENAEYFLGFEADEKYVYNIKYQKSTTAPPATFQGKYIPKIKNTNQISKIITAENIELRPSGIKFSIQGVDFNLKLLGEFNVYNSLAAICVGLSQEIDLETCKKALEKIKAIPGRLEIVIREPFRVVVDYAHTPDALRKVYETLRSINSKSQIPNPKQIQNFSLREISRRETKFQNSKLLCVLGAAGGGRDKWKRPELGKIAAKYCDQIILTNEDPYDENPISILEQIESGFSMIHDSRFMIQSHEKVLDRREAIQKALSLARPGDTVIMTGKGCEPWMMMAGGKKIPWDDRQIVREEFKKIKRV